MLLSASVIIPNLHSPHLGDVIQALRRQTLPPHEVIIVGQDRYGFAIDDGWLRVISTPQPVPPAVARNVGLAYARGEVCCFLDSDCIPATDWLAQLIRAQAAGHSCVGGGISVGGEGFWQRCDNIASMGPFLTTASAGERHYLITANLAIKRTVLRSVEGFDLQFRFPSGEDTDLAFRLRQQHYSLYFAPQAVVTHRTSRTTPCALWHHIWLYGHQWPLLQVRFPDLLRPSRWQRLLRYSRWLALLVIPMLALIDTYRIYAQQPALLRQHWATCPFVWWARMAWYVGRLDQRSEQVA